MTDDPTDLGLPTPSSARARGRITVVAIGVAGFTAGACAGAYLNWFWWEIGYRLGTSMLAMAIMVAAGAVSLIDRLVARRIGLGLAAVGVGMLAGQWFGPLREPLINHPSGSMILRLDSPVPTDLMGTAECSLVASGTEFVVIAQTEPRTGELGLPDVITVQLGDRWAYPRDNSRTDRVRFEIGSMTELHPDSIKVRSIVGMEATEASTLTSSFSTEGGSIQFRDLAPNDGPEYTDWPSYTGESIDFAGTLEWTCGPADP